jgi:hypothetical protein
VSKRTNSGDDLNDTYRSAFSRIEQVQRDAAARATKATSSTSGWQAAAKAAAAQAVLEATMAECRVVVAGLVEAGVRAGTEDRETTARRVREGFIDRLEPPALGLFTGAGMEPEAVAPAIAHHRAEFERCVEELRQRARDPNASAERTPFDSPQIPSWRQWLDVVGSIWVGVVAIWGGARLIGAQGPVVSATAVLVGFLLSYARWRHYENGRRRR